MLFDRGAFEGRRFLVTGASSGIGRGIAVRLAELGARLCVMGRDSGRLENTQAMLDGNGHSLLAAELGDVEHASAAIVAEAKDGGAFRGIFHAAGTSLIFPTRILKSAQIEDMIGSNLRSALAVAQAGARKGVVEDGGALVFMSSVAGLRGRNGMSLYSAVKASVDGMVRSLAAELAGRRIRANSIAAGAIETQMHEQLVASLSETALAEYRDLHMLGFGTTDDVAGAALFLLSDFSRWITGTTLTVDGGYTAK